MGQKKAKVLRERNARIYGTFREKVLVSTSQSGKPIFMEHGVDYLRVPYLSSHRVINHTGLWTESSIRLLQ